MEEIMPANTSAIDIITAEISGVLMVSGTAGHEVKFNPSGSAAQLKVAILTCLRRSIA